MKRIKNTKFDTLSQSTFNDWRHSSTPAISSRIKILQFEAEELDRRILALTASIVSAKEQRAGMGAILKGLTEVVSKR